jgi:23S rRNA pseudouridine1911/1915/1917 synthase
MARLPLSRASLIDLCTAQLSFRAPSQRYSPSPTFPVCVTLTFVHTLQFLHEDSDLFVVYKPAGLHSVRIPEGGGASLADLLLAHTPALNNVSRNVGDAGLVQRLDQETSGVLIGAKSRATWEKLFAALLKGEVQKHYIALVEGQVAKRFEFTSYLGSPHRGAKKVRIYGTPPSPPTRALQGTTVVLPVSFNEKARQSIVRVGASPARRHQVRAHLSHCGHPLVGDSLYGAKSSFTNTRQFFLHAERVSFIHPTTGERLEISSSYTDELSRSKQEHQ